MNMTRKIWDELTASGKLDGRDRRLPGPVVIGEEWVSNGPPPRPVDPAALANWQRQTGGCHGCGQSPPEGM